jgi:hypothetical protein
MENDFPEVCGDNKTIKTFATKKQTVTPTRPSEQTRTHTGIGKRQTSAKNVKCASAGIRQQELKIFEKVSEQSRCDNH